MAANATAGFTWENMKWSLVFIFLIASSVLIHELAHYWVAKKMELQSASVTFLPVGGYSTYESLPAGKKAEIWIHISGPLANLVIAGVLLPFIQNE
ncbi:MAG: site-2 protease family protein, partial [Bacteroidota bacterium]|nr:site-2 protease family protein [Bacteroidota bacterium]